jgi:hypothetical protein
VRFLIDDCLSFELVKLAHDRGYLESTHVVWRKLAATKDWDLKPIFLAGDWTFVTMNSNDFRGPASNPGSRGNMLMLRSTQGRFASMHLVREWISTCNSSFLRELPEELTAGGDLINQVLEITLGDNDESAQKIYLLFEIELTQPFDQAFILNLVVPILELHDQLVLLQTTQRIFRCIQWGRLSQAQFLP